MDSISGNNTPPPCSELQQEEAELTIQRFQEWSPGEQGKISWIIDKICDFVERYFPISCGSIRSYFGCPKYSIVKLIKNNEHYKLFIKNESSKFFCKLKEMKANGGLYKDTQAKIDEFLAVFQEEEQFIAFVTLVCFGQIKEVKFDQMNAEQQQDLRLINLLILGVIQQLFIKTPSSTSYMEIERELFVKEMQTQLGKMTDEEKKAFQTHMEEFFIQIKKVCDANKLDIGRIDKIKDFNAFFERIYPGTEEIQTKEGDESVRIFHNHLWILFRSVFYTFQSGMEISSVERFTKVYTTYAWPNGHLQVENFKGFLRLTAVSI